MATTTTTPNVRLSSLPPVAGRAGLSGAIASEFTKLRSVRSTYWTLGALFIVSVGLGIAIAAGTAANFNDHPFQKVAFDATQTSLGAFFELGQLIIAVIGAMVITSEYAVNAVTTEITSATAANTIALAA
jgi:ABC-2 type transport system permease protein